MGLLDFTFPAVPIRGEERHLGTAPTPQGVVVRGLDIKIKDVRVEYPDRPESHGHPLMLMRVEVSVPHRDTGTPISVSMQRHMLADMGEANAVRTLLAELLLHELDECIYVRGERVFDPHKSDGTP